MGQAAVDLPDPLSKPPSPLSGADDLLSQMAGEQIDRLIAESESAKAAIATPNDPFASQLDDLFNQLNSAPADLLTIEQIAVPAAAPPSEPPVIAAAAPAVNIVQETIAPPVVEQATSAAERAALTPPVDPIAAIEALPPTPKEAKDRVSILVRILELINLPFAACPDVLRDLLGKFAILTLMNSVGVILYVMIFRKH